MSKISGLLKNSLNPNMILKFPVCRL